MPDPSPHPRRAPLDLNQTAEAALLAAVELVPTDQPDEAVEAVVALVLGSLRPQVERAVRQVMGAMP